MGQTVDLGVFMPITNDGWIISKTSPKFMPSFELNRDICQLAERVGFNYVFAMGKWRGFGGETDFWKYQLESTTLMAGLVNTAPRLRMIASVAPALIHPAVFAKMATTMDDIAGGRLGINIVSAGNRDEYAQMGLYPDNFEDFRYDYTEEWLTVVKRLWTEDSVTFKGKYFTLDDCQSWPKPGGGAMPIVCATSSERGFQFIADYCTDGFFGGTDIEVKKARSHRIKEVAGESGQKVRTHMLAMLILGETDEDAQRIMEHYQDGADEEAIANIFHLRARGADERRLNYMKERTETRARLFYGGMPFVGGPETVADMVEDLSVNGDIDGIMFIFPEFIEGLKRFDELVMPLLRKRKLTNPLLPDANDAA
jgi:pyrimidine oxygenase